MDFDDDDDDEQFKQPPKPPRFTPKSRFQPKSRRNPAAVQPKPETSTDGAAPPLSVKNELEPIDSLSTPLQAKPEDQNGSKSELSVVGDDDSMDVDTRSDGVGVEVDEDEEDSVVREIDVYFNPGPLEEDTKLFVLQYPLRSSWRPYELDDSTTEVRVKPNSKDVEIDLSVGTENYDANAPSASKFTKLTLSSKWRPSNKTSAYAVGVYTGSELHLNPLTVIRQLRPSMKYLNPDASKKKNVPEVATRAKGSKAESSENQKAMDPKDDEPYITLKCRGPDTDLSATYRRKMLVKVNSSVEFPLKPLEYLDSLCPQAAIGKMKHLAPTKRSLFLLPLDQRLRLLFTEGPAIHKFSALKHYAPDHPKEEDLVQALEQFALLVQGYWVAKTAIRYPDKKPPYSIARDYVLALFMQSTTIKTSDLMECRKVEEKVWTAVLSEIAIQRPKCEDWKFREPTDMIFIKQHSGIMEDSVKRGKAKEEELRGLVRRQPTKAIASGKLNQLQISERTPGSRIGTRTMSSEAREALPKALLKLFQTNKVLSLQSIMQGVRSSAISTDKIGKTDANVAKVAAFGFEAPHGELLEVISEVAVDIYGTFILKSSVEHPELNDLRAVVISLFIGKGPNAKVKKGEIIEAAKMQLKKEPNSDEVLKVVNEFCDSIKGAWMLKPSDGGASMSSFKK